MNYVWLNGRVVEEKKATVSVFDHAFLYGDGLYETVRLYDGVPFLWPDHYQRLKKSARALHFVFPWSAPFLKKAIHHLALANHRPEGSVRLTLSRGVGALGLDSELCSTPSLIIHYHPDRPIARWQHDGVDIGFLKIQPERDPFYKSTSAQPLVRARVEAKRLRWFEGILLNARGEITEGVTTNFFFLRQNVLHTPALSCGLLPGVTRAHVLKMARHTHVVKEGIYKPADIFRAEELFLTNASLEILPVKSVRWGTRLKIVTAWPATRRLLHLWTQGRQGRIPTML